MYHERYPEFRKVQGVDPNFKGIEIMRVEAITGIKDLQGVFDDCEGLSDSEAIYSFLNKKYHLNVETESILDFLIDTIGFSPIILEYIDAREEEFYFGLTIPEALMIVLNKLFGGNNDIRSSGGYPHLFNFSGIPNNVQNFNGKNWLPHKNNRQTLDGDKFLSKVLRHMGIAGNILFHGTSWNAAINIMRSIRIIPRDGASDFDFKMKNQIRDFSGKTLKSNFYLGDDYNMAWRWASHHRQSAICIFALSDEFLNSIENHLQFEYGDEWKKLIFKARNPPTPEAGRDFYAETDEYDNFINYLDTQDLISEPFCKYVNVTHWEDIDCIKNGNIIPIQYAFKDSTINLLNDKLVLTIFREFYVR